LNIKAFSKNQKYFLGRWWWVEHRDKDWKTKLEKIFKDKITVGHVNVLRYLPLILLYGC
jgi:hypothetical protein